MNEKSRKIDIASKEQIKSEKQTEKESRTEIKYSLDPNLRIKKKSIRITELQICQTPQSSY